MASRNIHKMITSYGTPIASKQTKTSKVLLCSLFQQQAQVLMGVGLAWRPPCLPHSQVLMGAGLAGRPPCLPHTQVLMGAGLAGRPPCLPHTQVLMGAGLAKMHQHIPTLKLDPREKIKITDWSPNVHRRS